jgi:hypothetical protein
MHSTPKQQSAPHRFYDNDGTGLPPATSAEHKRLAMLQLGLAGRGEATENYIAAAQVHMLAALLTRIEEDEARFEAERGERETQLAAEADQRAAELRDLLAPPRPPVRVRVFHNTRHIAMAFGYVDTDSFVEVYDYDEPTVMPGTSDEQIVDRVFELFNVGDDPTYGEPDHRAVEYRDRRNRSLSKGDAIAIDGRFYVCASSGWTPIPKPQLAASGQHGSTPLYGPQAQAQAQ